MYTVEVQNNIVKFYFLQLSELISNSIKSYCFECKLPYFQYAIFIGVLLF